MRRIAVPKQQIDDYIAERMDAPCFICEIAMGGQNRSAHHVLHEDKNFIIFLSAMPTQYGHVLVCPRQHVEKIMEDLNLEAYVALQRMVWAAGRAIEDVVNPERIYVASFGSQQMNRHIHIHVVPLPSSVPIREQQMAAMMPESVGIVHLEEHEWAVLRDQLRAAITRYI